MALSTDDIISIIAEAFDIDAGELSLNTEKDDIQEWDSLGMLMLMAELDERFDVEIEEEKLESLQSIQDIVDLVSNMEQAA